MSTNPQTNTTTDTQGTDQAIAIIKSWLGTGSINIFGLPMSGKDTVGTRLAEVLGAKFLSSGDIIRNYEATHNTDLTGNGQLAPTDAFYDIVLPYFSHSDLACTPLVLSSIGRWSGEEDRVMEAAKSGGHEIKAVIHLNLSEDDVKKRWLAAQTLGDRGTRADDSTAEIFERRLTEFREKTTPVLTHYSELGLLIEVDASPSRDQVFQNVIDALYNFVQTQPHETQSQVNNFTQAQLNKKESK